MKITDESLYILKVNYNEDMIRYATYPHLLLEKLNNDGFDVIGYYIPATEFVLYFVTKFKCETDSLENKACTILFDKLKSKGYTFTVTKITSQNKDYYDRDLRKIKSDLETKKEVYEKESEKLLSFIESSKIQ